MNYFSFEQWDAIADSYIPIMALICASTLVYGFLKDTRFLRNSIVAHIKQTTLQFSVILISIIWVYTLMFLDNHFKIWPSISFDQQILDYSTHTALALVFSCFLFCYTIISHRFLAWLVITSMVLYLLLMKYQNYHTFADMLTTTIIVLPPMFLIMKKYTRPFVNHTPLTNTL